MLKSVFSTFMLTLIPIFMISCTPNQPVTSGDGAKISGTLTYDRVPSSTDDYGMVKLDYANTRQETIKDVVVKALDENGQEIYSTTSNQSGQYTVYVPKNTHVKIRVYARMHKENQWDVSVVDNTQMKAMYVIEGGLHDSGSSPSIRDIRAASGWTGEAYTNPRDAAPFAILDSINQAMQKVLQASSDAIFPQLTVNWSVNNVAAGGDRNAGQIVTSNYDGDSNLWILGDANSDTDEYDDHIIVHEWGHYFEDKFSRSDSIGGPHSISDSLDIRVAFGEGWGNALSAIATDNPVYFDTAGFNQASGWSMNIENDPKENPGWFSEGSVQRILYDLYDSNNDGSDNLSLGFAPIYKAMIGKERNAPAFTSIFTFIDALKKENSRKASKIDQVVSAENISSIQDAFGNYRTNLAQGNFTKPVYRTLEVGKWVSQCNQNNFGVYNKLGNRTYIKVHITTNGTYRFDADPDGSAFGDPDIVLYKAQYPLKSMGMSPVEGQSSDSLSMNLSSGDYLVEVYDASFNNSCFIVKLNKETAQYSKTSKMSKALNNRRRPERQPQY